MTNKSKNSRPTPEEIAERNASAEYQFGRDLAKLINASGVEKPQLVAVVLCQVLIQGNLEQYPLSAISALAERAVAALVPR